LPDIAWLTPEGDEMTDEHWQTARSRSLQVFLDGAGILVADEHGEPIIDDSFLIVFHAHPEGRTIRLPDRRWGASWRTVLDTSRGFMADGERYHASSALAVPAFSLWLFRREAS
jgi:glycogen operon protein